MDRRQEKTRQAIQEALISEINAHGLHNLTVSSLTKTANINRATFYLHYDNIDDLMEWIQADIVHELTQTVDQFNTADLAHNYDDITQLLTDITHLIAAHADLLSALLGPNGSSSMRITFEQVIANIVSEKMNELPHWTRPAHVMVPDNYVAVMISAIYTSVIWEWFDRGMQESPEAIAQFISEAGIQPIANYGLNPFGKS